MAGPLFAGLAELALWRGDLEQAKQLVAEAVPLVQADPRYAAPLYALGLRVEADRAELARARHPGQPSPDDGTATTLLERLNQAAAGPVAAGIPEVAAWHALAAGRADPPAGSLRPGRLGGGGHRLGTAGPALPGRLRRLPPGRGAAGRRRPRHRRDGAGSRRRNHRPPGRPPLDAEVQALARRARLDLAPHAAAAAPPSGASTPAEQLGLTPREVEVLALVAAGRSNRQIAQALFISPKTASVHVSNILAKLGVAGRVEAAAIAHRLGLD